MGLFLSILGKSSLKLTVTYSTYTGPWHVSISELNESEVEIRLEIFWAYIRIDKNHVRKQRLFVKAPNSLCADINSIFSQTLLILPEIRMYRVINQGSVVYTPVHKKLNINYMSETCKDNIFWFMRMLNDWAKTKQNKTKQILKRKQAKEY